MKIELLVKIEKVIDDGSDICEKETLNLIIFNGAVRKYLKDTGEEGKLAFIKMLDYLKSEILKHHQELLAKYNLGSKTHWEDWLKQKNANNN